MRKGGFRERKRHAIKRNINKYIYTEREREKERKIEIECVS